MQGDGDDGAGGMLERPSVRVLSWNIYRNRRPALVERELRRLLEAHAPDVVLVQEAPRYEAWAFSDLPVLAGYEAFYVPLHRVVPGSRRFGFVSTGQLILSRRAPVETAAYVLPPVRRLRESAHTASVRRVAAYARYRHREAGHLGVYNVHLENRALPGGRLAQVRHLLTVIDRSDDDVVVVGGDFNTFMTTAFERGLHAFEAAGFANLFRGGPRRWLPRLDYFMVRGAPAHARSLRALGSDHQPILARVALSS